MRNTPWVSEPRRSASVMKSPRIAASAAGRPAAVKARVMKALSASAETRAGSSLGAMGSSAGLVRPGRMASGAGRRQGGCAHARLPARASCMTRMPQHISRPHPIPSSSTSDPVSPDPTPETQTHPFQAEVAQLLHLMVHSVYSETDIFLRELISNASDACDRLRYEAIAQPEHLATDSTLRICIRPDKEAGTLTISDNGIGMDRH